MVYGITTTGFNKKEYSEVVDDLVGLVKSLFGNSTNTEATAAVGTLIRLAADQDAETWEVLQQLYNSIDINTATGQALVFLGALLDFYKLPATAAVGEVTFTVDATTTIEAGTIISVSGAPSQRFQTTAELVLTVVDPATEASGSVAVQALSVGPIVAPIASLTVLESTVSGVTAVTNAAAIIDGTLEETDLEFRQRILSSRASAGRGTSPSLLADLLAIASVESATINEGLVDPISPEGVPFGYIEVIVEGADDTATENAVAQALYNNKTPGIPHYSFSEDSGTATDPSSGQEFTMAFTKPTVVALDLQVNLTVTGAFQGAAAAKTVVETYLSNLEIGEDMIISKISSALAQMAGVEDVVSVGWRLTSVGGAYSTSNRSAASRDTHTVTTLELV